jgi:hypothetical protein
VPADWPQIGAQRPHRSQGTSRFESWVYAQAVLGSGPYSGEAEIMSSDLLKRCCCSASCVPRTWRMRSASLHERAQHKVKGSVESNSPSHRGRQLVGAPIGPWRPSGCRKPEGIWGRGYSEPSANPFSFLGTFRSAFDVCWPENTPLHVLVRWGSATLGFLWPCEEYDALPPFSPRGPVLVTGKPRMEGAGHDDLRTERENAVDLVAPRYVAAPTKRGEQLQEAPLLSSQAPWLDGAGCSGKSLPWRRLSSCLCVVA